MAGKLTREELAIHHFNRAMDELRKIPRQYHVYVASGTPCLMSGPTHDEVGRPLKANVVHVNSVGVRIDGGDW